MCSLVLMGEFGIFISSWQIHNIWGTGGEIHDEMTQLHMLKGSSKWRFAGSRYNRGFKKSVMNHNKLASLAVYPMRVQVANKASIPSNEVKLVPETEPVTEIK